MRFYCSAQRPASFCFSLNFILLRFIWKCRACHARRQCVALNLADLILWYHMNPISAACGFVVCVAITNAVYNNYALLFCYRQYFAQSHSSICRCTCACRIIWLHHIVLLHLKSILSDSFFHVYIPKADSV